MVALKASEISVKLYGRNILNKISFSINQGEQWAITGPSGSGKTTLLKALEGTQAFTGHLTFSGNNPQGKIVMVEQQHHFRNLSNTSSFYYQQRFNSGDSEDAVTVEEDLHAVLEDGAGSLNALTDLFGIKKLFGERLIQLSNGENKRLQIVKALLLEPAFLLLDNPFIGLDTKSRQALEEVLGEVGKKGVHIILATSALHLPFFITHILPLSASGNFSVEPVALERPDKEKKRISPAFAFNRELLKQVMAGRQAPDFEFAVKMKNVSVTYDRRILDNISWEVRKGERWSLSGPNGSGKSTLLSLVNADNPQAYANEIYLFDRRRGTGESIWDIKKKTGFLSPELHLYFEKGISCFDVVASGLFDTIGLFRQVDEEQSLLVQKWLQLLHIENTENKSLSRLSNSEQRLVLLARALVKNPPLLILDEPCQGLDEEQITSFKEIVDEICLTGNTTLVYVSHYAHEIPACVTKFIRLENGRRIE